MFYAVPQYPGPPKHLALGRILAAQSVNLCFPEVFAGGLATATFMMHSDPEPEVRRVSTGCPCFPKEKRWLVLYLQVHWPPHRWFVYMKIIQKKRHKNGVHTLSGFQTLGPDIQPWSFRAPPTYHFSAVFISTFGVCWARFLTLHGSSERLWKQ